jgi:hypothetical protein
MKNAINREIVRSYIARTVATSEQYQGSWTAPFLLTDVHSETWVLRTGRTKEHEGDLVETMEFSWDIALGDGQRLSQPAFLKLRILAQKVCFLARSLPDSGIETTQSHIAFMRIFLVFLRWCVRQGTRLNVIGEGLRRVDTKVLEAFLRSYSEEGVLGVMQFHKQILRVASERLLGDNWASEFNNSLYQLPSDVKECICSWLEKENLYSKRRAESPRHVDRQKLAVLLEADVAHLQGDRFMAFLRQFEPEMEAAFPGLCVSSDVRTEFPSHRTITVQDVAKARPSASRMSFVVGVLRSLFALHRHLPDSLPSSENFDFSRLRRFISNATRDGHTPWMPLELSLHFLREALRWVSEYGNEIVDLFIGGLTKFRECGWLSRSGKGCRTYKEERDDWVRKNAPDKLHALNLSGWSAALFHPAPYAALRASPTMVDALRILIGACTTVISTLKPVRMGELESLPRTCVSYKAGDGYWISHERGKAAIEDAHMRTNAPIPLVAAQAVNLLARIGIESVEHCDTRQPWAKNALYFLPDFSLPQIQVAKMGKRFIYSTVNLLADYIDLPPDAHGRRWYPRVHEHRKGFIIAFVWCFKFAAIDAARQLVGHADEKHILAYLATNFPGEQIPAYYAQYVTSLLWNFQASNGRDVGATDLEKLYQIVRRHFRVKDISELSSDDLESWLELQFIRKRIDITPYFVSTKFSGARLFAVKVVIRPQ